MFSSGSTSPSASPPRGGGGSGASSPCSIRIAKLRLIETGEELHQWQARARKQWGNGSALTIRMSTATNTIGTTPPLKLHFSSPSELEAATESARNTAGGSNRSDCCNRVGLGGISWEAMDWQFAIQSNTQKMASKGSSLSSRASPPSSPRSEGGAANENTTIVFEVISHERVPGNVVGIATTEVGPFLASNVPHGHQTLHVYPATPLSDDTVHCVIDVDLYNNNCLADNAALSKATTGSTNQLQHTMHIDPTGNISGLTSPVSEARTAGTHLAPFQLSKNLYVSTQNLFFPSQLITADTGYLVSNVVFVDNTSEQVRRVALNTSSAPRHVSEGLRVHPANSFILGPKQKGFFSVTWSSATQPVLPSATIHLEVLDEQPVAREASTVAPAATPTSFEEEGGESVASPPAAPTATASSNDNSAMSQAITLFFSSPQAHQQQCDTPYHYWVNTVCVTNIPHKIDEVLPYVRSVLPVFLLQSGSEDDLFAVNKDSGEVTMVGFGTNHHNVHSAEQNKPSISPLRAVIVGDIHRERTGQPPKGTHVVANPAAGTMISSIPQGKTVDDLECCCVLSFGQLRGLPPGVEQVASRAPRFKIVIISASEGWHIVSRETSPVIATSSGSIRWAKGAQPDTPVVGGSLPSPTGAPVADDHARDLAEHNKLNAGPLVGSVTLRKDKHAPTSQSIRLGLVEVSPKDESDETPIGSAILTLPSLNRPLPASASGVKQSGGGAMGSTSFGSMSPSCASSPMVKVALAFHVFDSFSQYDTMSRNSLLMTGTTMEFLLD